MLLLVTLSAKAEVIINGGFGTDGATGKSMPLATSSKDAEAIYKALNVEADGRGKKTIAIADESHFECSEPSVGMSPVHASCMFILRASQKAELVRGQGLSATVTFSGELATKIHKALPADRSGRAGASVKTVGNLSCSKVVRPGVDATCTIKNTHALSMNIDL